MKTLYIVAIILDIIACGYLGYMLWRFSKVLSRFSESQEESNKGILSLLRTLKLWKSK